MTLKQSFRIIFRNKTYSLLNIFGLAIGITAAALIMLWVEYELNYDRAFLKSDNIYLLGHTETASAETFSYFSASNPVAVALSSDISGVKSITRQDEATATLAIGNTGFKEIGWYCDPSLFGMVNLDVRGAATELFASPGSVVISEALATKLFGNNDPIGQNIKFDGTNDLHITGVFKAPPRNSRFSFEWLRPFEEMLDTQRAADDGANIDNWFSHWMQCFVELEPTADAAAITASLNTFVTGKTGTNHTKQFLYPLDRMHLYGDFKDGKPTGSGYIRTVRLFAGIAFIILLIACINFMNLTTARSDKRSMEVGVRKTFGAKRSLLIGQFMRESGIITAISLLLALVLIWLTLPAFNALVDKGLAIQLTRPSHLIGITGIGLVCTLLAGGYPAFFLSAFNPVTLAKSKSKSGMAAGRVRQGLVVFQFAVAFVLICATSVIYLQIQHIRNRPLGYDKEQVIIADADEGVVRSFQALHDELQGSSYFVNSALSAGSILNISSSGWGYDWQGRPDNLQPVLTRMYVGPGFAQTMGLNISAGRDFAADNEADKNRVLINRHFADLMGAEGHPGTVIKREGNWEIGGIVDNFVFNDLNQMMNEPVIIFNSAQYADKLSVRVKSGVDMRQAVAKLEETMRKFSKTDAFVYAFMDEEFGRMFGAQEREGRLAGVFSILAILISCLGLFGLSAFAAEQRIKEIGVRKVLGASVLNLVRLLVDNFLVLISISLAVGLPAAWYVTHKWLSSYEYRIKESWYIFAFAALLLMLIAILTVSWQALKAATANPVKSIKTE